MIGLRSARMSCVVKSSINLGVARCQIWLIEPVFDRLGELHVAFPHASSSSGRQLIVNFSTASRSSKRRS